MKTIALTLLLGFGAGILYAKFQYPIFKTEHIKGPAEIILNKPQAKTDDGYYVYKIIVSSGSMIALMVREP